MSRIPRRTASTAVWRHQLAEHERVPGAGDPTAVGGAVADPPGSSAWQLMGQPAFLRFFLGNFVSNVGTWFQDIAAAILIFQLTGSATLVAGLAVCAHGTSLLLSPLGGQLADRFDRRRLLIVTHVVQGSAAGVLAVLAWLGLANVWAIFAVALVIGAGRAFNSPTLQALLPALVSPRDLAPASALQNMTFNLARVIGPLLGALLMAAAGAGPAFAVNSVSFFVFVALLASIRIGGPVNRRRGGRFTEGIRYVWHRPRLGLILVACLLIGMSTDPVITLGPALATSFGNDATNAGWYVSAFGTGAVTGAFFVGMIRRWLGAVRTGVICLFAIVLAFAGVSVSGSPLVALVLFGIGGFAFLVGNSDLIASIQEVVDDSVRGRVMAIWSMAFVGSRPLAALLDGTLADLVGPRFAVGGLGLVIALVTVAVATGLAFSSRASTRP